MKCAALLFFSGLFLLYSAVVVPFQICMWDYSDPCNVFPTLRLDIVVDSFFLVIVFHEMGRQHSTGDYRLVHAKFLQVSRS